MRIGIDVRVLTKQKTSGVEEYTRLLLSALFRRMPGDRFELYYNAFRKNPLPSDWSGLPNVSVINRRVPNKFFDIASRALRIPSSRVFSSPDIVFSPHITLFHARPPVKRVMFIHDISFEHYPEFFPARKRLWHWQQNYRNEMRRAAALVVGTEFTKNDIVSTLAIPRERITVIPLGVNPFYRVLPKNDPGLARFRLERGLGGPFLLYAGTLEPRKNIRAVVRAFGLLKKDARFRDLKLVLAGARGWLYRAVLKEAETAESASDILFWGSASFDDLRALYTLASVFVFPSFFEGFGLPPLEAQACGTPVVVSNRSSLPEVIGSSGMLVDPWDIGGIAEALNVLLSDDALHAHYVARGLENAARFDWEIAAQKYEDLFRRLITNDV